MKREREMEIDSICRYIDIAGISRKEEAALRFDLGQFGWRTQLSLLPTANDRQSTAIYYYAAIACSYLIQLKDG